MKSNSHFLAILEKDSIANETSHLAFICLIKYNKKFTSSIVIVGGEKHNPTIRVTIELPTGKTFDGVGSNQVIARKEAAKKALTFLGIYNK